MQGTFNPALVWQQYNPYPNLEMSVNDLWLFIDTQAPGANEEALNIANPITSGLRQVLTLYSGALKPKAAPDGQTSKLKHTPLLSTGALSGMLDVEAAQKVLNRQSNLLREEGAPIGPQVIAMAIEGAQSCRSGSRCQGR